MEYPKQINIELTTACNHSCRYCYNFWRHEGVKDVFMSKGTIDAFIDDMIGLKVANVVLTGGEPFANYDVLLHAVERLTQAGVKVSCNSNLTLAKEWQLKELRQAGLPHILTSLASFDPEVNDSIFGKDGAYYKVIKNIINAVNADIKISINTIVTRQNKDHIYKTGLLAYALGASNLFLTRVVPSTACSPKVAAEFMLKSEEYLSVLDGALRVKEETGINIGSLIQYPICFLGDTKKYKDFIGRGCHAQGKMLCINANGETHACFHEEKSYGNILEIGIARVWENLRAWRDGSLIPEVCQGCNWFRWCEGGCRVSAKTLNGLDCMYAGDNLPEPTEDYEEITYAKNWKKHDR